MYALVNLIRKKFLPQKVKLKKLMSQSDFWDKIIEKVDVLDRTTYFRFFIALNILYCIFL